MCCLKPPNNPGEVEPKFALVTQTWHGVVRLHTRQSGTERPQNLHMIIKQIQVGNAAYNHIPRELTLVADVVVVLE